MAGWRNIPNPSQWEVSTKQICHPVLPIPDFGPGGTVQRAEQPLRPRRGLPPAKENRRVCCQVGDFGTLASLMGRTLKRDLPRVTETRVRRGIMVGNPTPVRGILEKILPEVLQNLPKAAGMRGWILA